MSAEPYDRDDLIAALEDVHREVADGFASIAGDDFFRHPEEGVWSPAENLIHLNKSVKAVASGLGMPKLVLAAMFGTSKGNSRSFAEVRDLYHELLAKGGRASGRYVPPTLDLEEDEAAQQTRSRILSGWSRAGEALIAKTRGWKEASLDKYRMPHPLLGKLTVREMLFFTLYHNRHHLESVRRRIS